MNLRRQMIVKGLTCCWVPLLLMLPACQSPPKDAPMQDPMLRVDTLIPAPDDYAEQRIGVEPYPIPPHAKFLAGVKICLDPGHGGEPHRPNWKRGPTGVREAEVNLRVAKYLRTLLEAAGAEVLLTREQDTAIDLAPRAQMANEWGADIFISLHHNAVDNKPHVNYTSVWYHRDVDYRPASLDVARHLCLSLFDELQLPQLTDVPLKSDQLMYEDGFGVLRHCQVPAALTESSFHSNPEQEQLLRDPEHNLREAYALFTGLARYATGGLPRTTLAEPADGVVTADTPVLVFELDDGLRGRKSWGHDRQMILTDTIAVRLDGERVPHVFTDDGETYTLAVDLPPDLSPGVHVVNVQFHNMFKNAVLHPRFEIERQ